MVVLKRTRRTVKKDEIDYPSKENPRIEGLNVDNPKMLELAKSIQRNGLLVPPLLGRWPDGRLENLDGDRRTICVFDILHWETMDVDVIKMPEKPERYVMRMVANDDRSDFTSLEKGAYMYEIMMDDMANDGLNIEEVWNTREIRTDYLRATADKLGKSITSVGRYVSLWRNIPPQDRTLIARNRDELRLGYKISPSKAAKILRLGRNINNVKAVWRSFVPEDAVKTKKPIPISGTELEILRRKSNQGQINTIEQFNAFRTNKEAEDWSQVMLYLKKHEEKEASKIAASFNIDIQQAIRASILLAPRHIDDLESIVREGL